ncbi:MAG: hypothetical protein Q8K78_13630, partial [Planctomycetaceae bacterium]|nr:hypothetical protein [Planctomycetaceae bacterium]
MSKSLKSGLSWGLGGLLIIAALVYGFRTPPVEIDLVMVTTGPLSVTVEEDGRTRVKERYVVSSPLAGRLLRVELHSGDSVVAGETVVATIEASDPSLLDDRARADAAARVNAAMAERDRVATRIEASRDALRIVRNELDRAEELFGKKVATAEVYETAQLKFRLATHEQSAAEFGIK